MELERLEKRIRALQARKAARAATFERVQGIDPTEHEAAVYHAIHEDIAADAHTYYNLPGGRGSCKSSFVSLEIVDGIQKDPTGTGSAVVFRRWGSTLRESVFAQIQWAIDALGVSDLWSCTVSPMVMVPSSGVSLPVIMRNRVDLPAPFGPMSASTCPLAAPSAISRARAALP